jgi:hypothetical protein
MGIVGKPSPWGRLTNLPAKQKFTASFHIKKIPAPSLRTEREIGSEATKNH